VVLGRTVATVAELSLVGQCALLIREAGRELHSAFAFAASRWLLPVILAAELCSWYAVLTKHYGGAVVEESLWTVAGVLLLTSLLALWSKADDALRLRLAVFMLFGVAYTVFMVTVDVPLYYARLQADLLAGVQYLSPLQGVADAASRCRVTSSWEVWRDEVPWMALYFTVAVWLSIALIHLPETLRPRKRPSRHGRQLPVS
jgi:hypothetical protein